MTQQRRIIKQIKQHKLYTTYRGILNFYLNEYDKKGKILLTPLPKKLFEAIKQENIHELIKLLKYFKIIQPKTEKQIENFKKVYLYKSKINILK